MTATSWKSYEEVAQHLLSLFSKELGLKRVEGKQFLEGDSGTTWEIDAKGVREGGGGIVLVECRRYTTSRLKQEHVAAFAFKISDTGAKGGITVSPLPMQEGANLIAKHHNIIHVLLTPDSTTEEYVLKFLNSVFVGFSATVSFKGSLEMVHVDKDGNAIGRRTAD